MTVPVKLMSADLCMVQRAMGGIWFLRCSSNVARTPHVWARRSSPPSLQILINLTRHAPPACSPPLPSPTLTPNPYAMPSEQYACIPPQTLGCPRSGVLDVTIVMCICKASQLATQHMRGADLVEDPAQQESMDLRHHLTNWVQDEVEGSRGRRDGCRSPRAH